MATFSREPLSGSTSGTPIAVTSTNSAAAATVHTCDTNKHEIYLFASNESTAAVDLYTELGDTVSPVIQSIPARQGLVPVLPGSFLTGNKVVRAYCSTVSTAAIAVSGWVNKIS
jgi:hypothetical protein